MRVLRKLLQILRIENNSYNKWLTSCLHCIFLISPGSWWGHLSELYVLAVSKGSNFKGNSPGNEVAGLNGLSYPAGLSGLGEPTRLNSKL